MRRVVVMGKSAALLQELYTHLDAAVGLVAVGPVRLVDSLERVAKGFAGRSHGCSRQWDGSRKQRG